jgi:hypothetical protein
VGHVIYGLPCHASEVLRIDVTTRVITKLAIPYEEFYNAEDPTGVIAKEQREMIWKYHGGSISPHDGCIYAIPQSACHVLKIDPETDTCSLVGPTLDGKYKWYGGVVGQQDGAIYGIPHNSRSILRIMPSRISLHGDFGTGGHKWHGASTGANGIIVGVPANADTVLCITPAEPDPTWTEIGNADIIQTGRHRTDGKYKYLGAMTGPNGKVYVFPSGSEHVLQVDSVTLTVKNVGPNLRDHNMEPVVQNKWQNGLTCPNDSCVYAMPLSGHTVLRIDCSNSMQNGTEDVDPEVTTWDLPSPHTPREKWEGGVILPNGIMYTIPNNHKAVLRIEPYNLKQHVENNDDTSLPSNDLTQQLVHNTSPNESNSGPTDQSTGASTAEGTKSTRQPKTSNSDQNKKYVGTREEYGGDDLSIRHSDLAIVFSSSQVFRQRPKTRS